MPPGAPGPLQPGQTPPIIEYGPDGGLPEHMKLGFILVKNLDYVEHPDQPHVIKSALSRLAQFLHLS